MLIGLCGPAGAGKNTAAEMLGFRQTSFAAPLYRMLEAMLGIPVERLQDRRVKEQPIGWLGKSPRQLLQSLGTEWGRAAVAEDVWVRATLREVEVLLASGDSVAITDVRFDNEAAAIRAAGGKVFRVVRSGDSCLDAATAAHASEAGVSDSLVDGVIVNSGSLDDLRDAVVEAILR